MDVGTALRDLTAKLAQEHDRLARTIADLHAENKRLKERVRDLEGSDGCLGLKRCSNISKGRERSRSAAASRPSKPEPMRPRFDDEPASLLAGDGPPEGEEVMPDQVKVHFCRVESSSTSNESDNTLTIAKENQSESTRTGFFTGRFERTRTGSLSIKLPQVHSAWLPDMGVSRTASQVPSRVSVEGNVKALMDRSVSRTGSALEEVSSIRFFILHPNSAKRMAWDITSMLIVSYDMVFIPFEFSGFNMDSVAAYLDSIDKVTATFWTVDMCVSFLTGYSHDGVIDMRPKQIAIHYARTWFSFDVIVVILDWIFLVLGANAVLRIGKSTRATRMIRTVRLVRSIKMHKKLNQVVEAVKSDALRTTLSILQLALCILVFNHYFACGWYFIGPWADPENNWVILKVQDHPVRFQYATALHWSLTQFTPAAMEIHPYNFAERVYAIVVLLCAMISFSTFTASITAHMTALRKLSSDPAKQQKVLQDFFEDYGVSADLGSRIWFYLIKNHFAFKKRSSRRDISLLKLLPPTLTSQLNEELYMPVLKKCPFFLRAGIVHYKGLCDICNKAVSENSVFVSEEIFHEGTLAESVLLLVSGNMMYEQRDRSDGEASLRVKAGQWVCEPVLFMSWHHCGSLVASTSCQTLVVHAGSFVSAAAAQPKTKHYAIRYIYHLQRYMVALMQHGATWRTDVWPEEKEIDQVAQLAMSETVGDHMTSILDLNIDRLGFHGNSRDLHAGLRE